MQNRPVCFNSYVPGCALRYPFRLAAALTLVPFICSAQDAARSPTSDQQESEAEPIVVSATRFGIPLDQSPASVSVVSSEDVDQKQIERVSDALREVRALLSAAADHIESCVVEAQHLCRDSGGADADNISIQGPGGRTVPCATATTEAFAGRLSADAPLVGTADERTSQEGSACSHTTGGER